MSELKAILATPHPKMKNACDGAIEVYLKSEADKVIADLEESHKMEVEQLLLTILELKEKIKAPQLVNRLNKPEALYYDLETMGRLSHEIHELKKACKDKDDFCAHTLKENRHHKYKRCLAMAKWCEAEVHKSLTEQSAIIDFPEIGRFQYLQWHFVHFSRWHRRWLELAEKFKEAK